MGLNQELPFILVKSSGFLVHTEKNLCHPFIIFALLDSSLAFCFYIGFVEVEGVEPKFCGILGKY